MRSRLSHQRPPRQRRSLRPSRRPSLSREAVPPHRARAAERLVATQVDGTVLVHEKMCESRRFFVDKLIGMGARITLCDPHRAVVSGPSVLHGSELVSPDVRAGMAMVIAALCARGESIIRNVYQIERGYENLTTRLQSLGARIERVSSC